MMARLTARLVATTAICTALVWVATVVFQLYIPETRGYFNVGESMVYASALLFGPAIGGFAGGVGSALADIATGYTVYAPGTLVIKAVEGFVAGALFRALTRVPRKAWKVTTSAVGGVLGGAVYLVGTTYYVTAQEPASLTLGLPQVGQFELFVSIPWWFWAAVAAVIVVSLVAFGVKLDPGTGALVLAAGLAGPLMVTGYLLYEYYVLGLGPAAFVEVPFNVGQVLVGIMIATPVVKLAKRALRGEAAL